MTTEHGGSERQAEPGPGPEAAGFWRAGAFTHAPLWARIVAPVVLVALLVAIVVGLVIAFSPKAPADPEDVAQSACGTAAEERLERRGHTGIEVSAQPTISEQADGGFRVQGTVTFVDDGDTHHADVRCIVRIEGGSTDVVSVRFND